jgi:hypothetical protein
MGKIAEIGEKLVLQIMVSVAATVCVAAITNTYLSDRADQEAAAPQQLASAEPHRVASLLEANFVADGFRTRVASIDEFAAVFGPNQDASFSPPVARDWSVETADLKADRPTQPKPRQVAACSDACSLPATGILPPARPVVVQTAELAQVAAPAAEVSEKRSLQLLGVSLPDLVPSPGRILTTVTAWGGSVADLVLR